MSSAVLREECINVASNLLLEKANKIALSCCPASDSPERAWRSGSNIYSRPPFNYCGGPRPLLTGDTALQAHVNGSQGMAQAYK